MKTELFVELVREEMIQDRVLPPGIKRLVIARAQTMRVSTLAVNRITGTTPRAGAFHA